MTKKKITVEVDEEILEPCEDLFEIMGLEMSTCGEHFPAQVPA